MATSFYEHYAALHIRIDMDELGTFATLPSDKDISVSYRIDVCESGDIPFATDCNCSARKPCKHLRVVTAYFARIYGLFLHKKEEPMNIPLTTDIDLSTLSPEDAQSLAELNAACDLALTEPLQDDEPTAQPSVTMTLAEARNARDNDAFAVMPYDLRLKLIEEDAIKASRASVVQKIEAAPLTKHAGFNCLLNVS